MEIKKNKVAIFLNIENIIQKEMVKEKCNEFCEFADIYIGNGKSDNIENLGIDIEASFKDYEYVVMINPFEIKPFELEGSYAQREAYYINNLIGDIQGLKKEIEILGNSKFEGILVSRIDYIKSYAVSNYEKWKDYYEIVNRFSEQNELQVVVSKEKAPIQIENGCAIIKTEALAGIEATRYGELSPQILSYMLPVYIQSRGFLPGYFMKKDMLKNNNMGYTALRQYSESNIGHNLQISSKYYYDFGEGFVETENNEIKKIIKFWKKDKVTFKIPVPEGVKAIRFNPCDGFMCVCAETCVEEDGVEIRNVNAQHFEKEDVFLTHKPEYVLTGDFKKYNMVSISMENISVFWSEHDFKYEIDKYVEEKEGELTQRTLEVQQLQEMLKGVENELTTIKSSKAWKFISMYRGVKNKIIGKK